MKRYLNKKILIHRRVTATISKFSTHIFETYFSISSMSPECIKELKKNLFDFMFISIFGTFDKFREDGSTITATFSSQQGNRGETLHSIIYTAEEYIYL